MSGSSSLARREDAGGCHTPFKYSNNQQICNSQVSLSFFLDLDWSIPIDFEAVKDDEKLLTMQQKAAREGALGTEIGTVAALRTELAIARDRSERLHQQASRFTVIDEYEEFRKEADDLTLRLRELAAADVIDRDLIDEVEAAAAKKTPPDVKDLERLWQQVNIVLPGHVRSVYDEVREFHESVIENRCLYLQREILQARDRLARRRAERDVITQRRSELLSILDSGGALEHFAALQAEAGRVQADARDLQRRYELAQRIEADKTKIQNRRMQLLLRLQADHRERGDRLAAAIARFKEYSRALYQERRGSLIVRETQRGPKFDIEIAGKGSVDIDSMQILCFDLTITTLLQDRGIGPGFLIHDSHIFGGVDERQIASAVMLGSHLAEKHGFQYIITMNTDSLPQFPKHFDIESHVNEIKLTDAIQDCGLFGFKSG